MTIKVIAISDTHLRHSPKFQSKIEIPDGDVLVHAGDSTSTGTPAQVIEFLEWYGSFPHQMKIFIAGNHDFLFERNPAYSRELCERYDVTWLNNQFVTYKDIKFYGSSYQPEFYNWAFNLPRNGDELKRNWSLVPDDTDILISHSPPHGLLDQCPDYRDHTKMVHVGCEALRAEIESKRITKLKAVICGHIHCSYGTTEHNGIKIINASICDEGYKAVNAPFIFGVVP